MGHDGKRSVLFACTGNTCRSVMAEHLARKLLQDRLNVASAGFHPQDPKDTANAAHTLLKYGIDASGHIPKDIRTVDIDQFDIVVAMDPGIAESVRRTFPSFPAERLLVWKIDDPWGDNQGNLVRYQKAAEAILQALPTLRPMVVAPTESP